MRTPTPRKEPTREDAQKRLAELAQKYGGGARLASANEAKTRLLLVDEILLALGWEKDEFDPEAKTPAHNFIDYLVRADSAPRFIVEAKRVGHTFSSPKNGLRKSEYKLAYLESAFRKPLTEVIEQARRYSGEMRVPFSVLTNGAEWILIQALPLPGTETQDLRCLYFGNLLGDDANFDLLWELLSRPAVVQNALEERFSILNRPEADYSVEPRTLLGELQWQDQVEDPHIREFYDRFFDEIVDPSRRKMLEHCYVSNARLNQYEGALKRALMDTAPEYLDSATELLPDQLSKILPRSSGDKKGRVVLVTGSVGAGKTTFVTKVIIENRAAEARFVDLDLIDETDSSDVSARIWKLLYDKWLKLAPESFEYEALRQLFHAELEGLKHGPKSRLFLQDSAEYIKAEADLLAQRSSDHEEFLSQVWSRGRKERVVVFLDNADRASENFQRELYAFAHRLAARTGVTVILPIRESTYWRAKENGFLDVRTTDLVFHLQAPDPIQVLSRRIRFIEAQLGSSDLEPDHRLRSWRQAPDWDEFRHQALLYAHLLKDIFLKDSSGTNLIVILAAIAWHNIREFLAILYRAHSFLSSQHVWTRDELLAALALSRPLGASRRLPVSVFRPVAKRYHCYLLKVRIGYFLQKGITSAAARRGTKYSRMLDFARGFGYQRS